MQLDGSDRDMDMRGLRMTYFTLLEKTLFVILVMCIIALAKSI